MSIVNDQVKVGVKMVSTPQGTFAYLKGVMLATIDKWLARMADIHGTTEEKIRDIVSDFIGVELTPAQCGVANGMLGLAAVIHASKDADAVRDFQMSLEKRKLVGAERELATQLLCFMNEARQQVAFDIIHQYQHIAQNGTLEERIEAYKAFGFSHKRAEELAPMASIPVDLWTQAGVDPQTFELIS